MKRILLALLAAVLLSSPVDSAAHRPRAFDSVRALAWTTHSLTVDSDTGMVVAESVTLDNHCTISSINEQKHLWLTAAHCVANEEMTELEEHDYQIGNIEEGYYAAFIVTVDMKKDLAILSAPDVTVRALKVSKHDVNFGDRLSVIGHPFGWTEAVLFVGTVAHPGFQFDPDDPQSYMIYQMAGAPGNSGSAVLNNRDEIVSVLQIGWSRSFSPVAGGAPWATMRAFVAPYLP